MSVTTIGAVIAVSPLVLLLIAVMAMGASTSDGRWGALFVFGATTLTMIPIIIGLAVAGNPAWVVGVWVTVGIDLLVAVIIAVMARVEHVRKGSSQ
ncbi:hypothetical protein OG874_00390 [Nocardia sp. NBC_00565]|uniref:hypothetical protein n=1 Tax=Nocardia sp. NBC_00565 TaxID=2975993 RepID=UPI002E806808|nr:hypothetical protein [Nocardia sp. NBC_00565]WUC03713.1 hypothetical protein OG874_00390 [Nocardia sp. NBC_00565]